MMEADAKMRRWSSRRDTFPGLKGWMVVRNGMTVLKKDGLIFIEKLAEFGKYHTSFCPDGLPKGHKQCKSVT